MTLIAVKREVAARILRVFRGANVKSLKSGLRKLATSHCTKRIIRKTETTVINWFYFMKSVLFVRTPPVSEFLRNTRKSVQSPLVVQD